MTLLKVIKLNRTSWKNAFKLQQALQQHRLQKSIPDTLVLTEHHPVYTLGLRKNINESLLWTQEQIKSKLGAEVENSFRGGDVTFFGPGTLMCYPIINLKDKKLTTYGYVDKLEDVMQKTLKDLEIPQTLSRIPDRRGLWVQTSSGLEKVGAIGVGVSKWVTIHGCALNVHTDLKYFEPIIPCGIKESFTTTIEQALKGQNVNKLVKQDDLMQNTEHKLLENFVLELGYEKCEILSLDEKDILTSQEIDVTSILNIKQAKKASM